MDRHSILAQTALQRPASIRHRRLRKHLLTRWASLMGAGVHFLFIPLFWWLGYPALALTNIVSVGMWLGAYLANERGEQDRAVYLIIAEAYCHAIIATLVLGTTAGFHFYLLTLACWAAVTHSVRWVSLLLGLMGMVIFLFLEFPIAQLFPVEQAAPFPLILATLNLAIALFTMIGFAMLARHVYETQEENLTSMATRDALTGLHNRRYAGEYLRQLASDRREGKGIPYSLALIDIDHFKLINDKHGHRVGDQCLIQLSDLLLRHFRRSDVLCRWGGEEFLLIFPGADLGEILPVLESFRKRLHSLPIMHNGDVISLTVSAGVTSHSPGVSYDALINHADRLLYRAKAEGRDCIVSDRADVSTTTA
ncbi:MULTISPECIES: GGDEF domain-containing protein [Halomonas]|uniref:GGDEF domain-containing protein n=1 Tax=Halomonas TaxID=2745 RepID=UPI001C93EAA3|nr:MULTISPECIES: GGDEF domain-containing protein [Halomonas]MBY6209654.1 GGDEF domain-containing protein [Halomonas sp. DP3Y7-2]MBY6226835.1 GGDEF domain-containing protein [Halomonas sp. DP3Y7-1]MCA0915418.1 GGDEF domain-containing protein [Halomonas denitrificans]